MADGVDAELEIRGPQLTDDERAHGPSCAGGLGRRLRSRSRSDRAAAAARGAAGAAAAAPTRSSAPLSRVASESLDKVVYEAAACEIPVLASNAALAEFLDGLPLELRFAPRDAAGLAARLLDLAAADRATRAETGAELRRRVVSGHSVAAWADAVAAAVGDPRPQ